jgi:hypothetical protein
MDIIVMGLLTADERFYLRGKRGGRKATTATAKGGKGR